MGVPTTHFFFQHCARDRILVRIFDSTPSAWFGICLVLFVRIVMFLWWKGDVLNIHYRFQLLRLYQFTECYATHVCWDGEEVSAEFFKQLFAFFSVLGDFL